MSEVAVVLIFVSALALICLSLYLYFLPTIIACHYDAENKERIFFLNLVTGWTCLGWILALFWALLEQYDVDLIEKIVEKLLKSD